MPGVLIIIVLSFLALFIYSKKFRKMDFLEMLLLVTISQLVLLGLSGIIGGHCEKIDSLSQEIPIVSLRDEKGLYGNFFLGSGEIADQQYLITYAKYDKGLVPVKFNLHTEKVFIKEGVSNPNFQTFFVKSLKIRI